MQNITLREFIDTLLNKCKIESNPKNVKKFRIKCQRSLQKLGFWDDAPTELQGRNIVKLFSKEQLDLLEADLFKYVIKQSKKNFRELSKIAEESIESNSAIFDTEEVDEYFHLPVSQYEQNNIMLRALFNLFFTDINIKQWQEDRELVALYEATQDDTKLLTLEYTLAVQRLNSENKSAYYESKKIKL